MAARWTTVHNPCAPVLEEVQSTTTPQLERIAAAISKLESPLNAADFRRLAATQATPVPIPAPPFCAPGPSLVSYPRPEPDPPDAPPLYDAALPSYQPNSNWNLPPPNQPPHQVQPRRATCWDPPGSRNPLDFPAYAHLPYGYDSALDYGPAPYQRQRSPFAYNQPGQQDRVWSYQLHRPSLPPLPIIKPTSCWGPPRQGDPFGPPQFDQHQPLPPPMHRPTCWDPPGQQGYPEYEQPSPINWMPSQLRLEPPLPTAAVPSSMRRDESFLSGSISLGKFVNEGLCWETSEKRCYGDEFTHTQSPKPDGGLNGFGCGNEHEWRNQRRDDFDSLRLNAHIGYSCDTSRGFDRFSNSGMDANGHRPLPHAESRPWLLNPALQTAPPFLEQQPAAVSDWHPPSLCSATTIPLPGSPEFRYDSPELIADVTDASEIPCPTTAIDVLVQIRRLFAAIDSLMVVIRRTPTGRVLRWRRRPAG